MDSTDVGGLLRHGLTSLGGGLVSSGIISGDDLNTVAGAIVIVVGIAWSLLQKRVQRKAIATALATPVPVIKTA